MDIIYYPLIYHEYLKNTSKDDCIAMFLPIDERVIETWSKYIDVKVSEEELLKIINDIYSGTEYDYELLKQHNIVGFKIYTDKHLL